jgi:hypothetical protein
MDSHFAEVASPQMEVLSPANTSVRVFDEALIASASLTEASKIRQTLVV